MSWSPETQPPQRLVVRIKSVGEVFFAEVADVREERPSLYRGFEQWGKDEYPSVALDQLVRAQKELRLFVELPGRGLCFCDLTDETPTADPLGVLANARRKGWELWEQLPYQGTSQQIFPPTGALKDILDAWEDSLFA